MEIPSLTPIVLNINPTYSDAEILFLILTDKSFKCMLQGLPSYPVLAIPMNGLSKSSSDKPIACNIAWAAG